MWDEKECQDRTLGLAEIRSSWAIVAAILVGTAAWTVLQLLLAMATAPPETGGQSVAEPPPAVPGLGQPE